MYLKSIEVQGFKSFATKLHFDFHEGITAIVGPNGSGKSNVADAVRWVLGEQSAKQLRGASMQDVIFAGTENRKPVGFAYVAITFDNSDHVLQTDYSEVTVSRRVYRSGESEYMINKAHCRLKDVNELFYDTGIGKEGYSIIGQGQIEKIINGRPEDRRELFDEAAGIVKFKRRKTEALKELADEEANLERINDIVSELEKQVIPLEKQSVKAREFLALKEEQKKYDINLFLLDEEQLKNQIGAIEKNLDITTNDYNQAKDAYDSLKIKYEELKKELEKTEEEISFNQEAIKNYDLEKEKKEGEIKVFKEQLNTLMEKISSSKNQKEDIDSKILQKEKNLSEYRKIYEDTKEELAIVLKKKENFDKEVAVLEEENKKLSDKIGSNKQEVLDYLSKMGDIRVELQRIETLLDSEKKRQTELEKGNEGIINDKENAISEISLLENKKEEISKEIEDLQSLVNQLNKKNDDIKIKTNKKREEIDLLNQDFHKIKARYDFLKNVSEKYEGYSEGVKKVMEQKSYNPGILGVIADIISANQKYELAIETALGGNLRNILTKDEATAKSMIAFLKKNKYGRVTFLPLEYYKNKKINKNTDVLNEKGVLGYAGSLVNFNEEYKGVVEYLLGKCLVVDNIDNATVVSKKYSHSIKIVTLEGDLLSVGGSLTGGAYKNNSNLLSRKREIGELKDKVLLVKDKIKGIYDEIETFNKEKEDIKYNLLKNNEKYHSLNLNLNTTKINLDAAIKRKEDMEKMALKRQSDMEEIESLVEKYNKESDSLNIKMEEFSNKIKDLRQKNDELEINFEEKKKKLDSLNNSFSKNNIKYFSLMEKEENAAENLSRVEKEIQDLKADIESFESNTSLYEENYKEKLKEIEEYENIIKENENKKEELIARAKELEENKHQVTSQNDEFFENRESLSLDMNRLDKEILRLNNRKENLNIKMQDTANYIWEEYQLTYHSALEFKDNNYEDSNVLKNLLGDIKQKIKALGEVNVNAIEEYKEIHERYDFLKTQQNDLIDGKNELLQVISKLEAGMRKQFAENFKKINDEFDRVFKKLFAGGRGTLEIMSDDDIIESGIQISVQPPGKKLSNMMQLSGGEKALSAIALLFAIQNLKPSPFCLLDEIEAALDDSNVDRYASYLHKLSDNTQFIVITHRRGTMASADRLYGITMQEKGVSTLVSVNLIEEELQNET
ncbi:condensin subunit Smc [Acetitomaculum ruminis DSM 5522]|uniref:Chromosome partition protein Smc n=1 Tax=Acetitomaculum ruminis DSM 5522 TaxID=1120918 RepID=A0A1I0VP60_9FIRM|nr:chromosome segregation protein SMC [Acetitomaculum ruminis]SFA78279.1 condensin subunit Smc [Acetitomaculum ruminis DSM 5522]